MPPAVCAPHVGGIADRKGPRRSLLLALSAVLLIWGLLAVFGDTAAGVIVGMIVLDMGATAADISNRTVIFDFRADIRMRLATIYMVGRFGEAGIMGWLAGLVWSVGDWPAICALGAGSAAFAALAAWVGIGKAAAAE